MYAIKSAGSAEAQKIPPIVNGDAKAVLKMPHRISTDAAKTVI